MIKNFRLILPHHNEYLSFKGHPHFYCVKKEKGKSERIYLPKLSDDPIGPNPKFYNGIVRPGFLTAEKNGDNIVVTHYSFVFGDIVKENEFKKALQNPKKLSKKL